MNVTFDVFKEGEHRIAIRGLSENYLPENRNYSELYPEKIKYTDAITLDVVYLNKLSGEELIGSYSVEHVCEDGTPKYLDEEIITLKEDGHYTIYQLIIPTKSWLNSIKDNENIIKYYKDNDIIVYIFDNNKLYSVNLDTFELTQKSIHTILANICGTNMSREIKDYVFTEYLWDCYIKNSRNILNNVSNVRCNKEKIDTFNRDFIWMTLNILKYHRERCEYREAQRLIEELTTCNGFCDNDTQSSKESGCGCH